MPADAARRAVQSFFDAASILIVMVINYNCDRVFVRHVFTHAEYDCGIRRMKGGSR